MTRARISFIGAVAAAAVLFSVVWLTAAAGPAGRYLIQSESGILRAIVGVRHNFDNGFTADLTFGQERALAALGVQLEPVALWWTTKPPGECEPWPECRNGGGGDDGGGGEEGGRVATPSDQTPWGIERVYNDATITETNGGAGVDVAVLDTGVHRDHLDLAQRVEQCKDFTKGPNVKSICDDGFGHGTHVAGTILADGGSDGLGIYGVAPEADLFAYKVCGNDGSCWTDDIAMAIRHAADSGAEIISMSLGGDSQSSLVRDAINYAIGNDLLVVAAAGNDGPDDGSIDYPGANASVVAVGAFDASTTVPDWSSRGINDGDGVVEEQEVEFGAPGVDVESTWSDGAYRTISGTSMATPHVSGFAAKMWQGSADATRAYLASLAEDIWVVGEDTAMGFGFSHQ